MMTFQFTCPQGHLLEGDPAHAGMQSQCPMCGTMFLIPQPPGSPEPGTPEPGGVFPGVGPAGPSPLNLNLGPSIETAPGAGPAAEAPAAAPAEEEPDPIIHILCPNGHELETPMSMVGSDAMCPHCEVPFRLRYEDSTEYREKRRQERERREAAFGRKMLNFAIITAVLVMASLIGLMVFYGMQK
jgi:hypothetical protein